MFCLDRQGAACRSLGLFRVVGFVRVRIGGCWVRFGSSGSSVCAMVDVQVSLARPVACPGSRWVGSRSSGSFVCALGIAGFVQLRPGGRWVRFVPLVRPFAPCMSLGSLGFVFFIQVRPGGRWVRSSLSGSSRCALGIIGMVRFCLGFDRVCLARPCAPCGSLGSIGFVR